MSLVSITEQKNQITVTSLTGNKIEVKSPGTIGPQGDAGQILYNRNSHRCPSRQ